MGQLQAKEMPKQSFDEFDDDSDDALLSHVIEAPARVDRVKVEGVGRTYDDIITDSIKQTEIFKSSTFGQVILQCHEVRNQLERLQCFQGVQIEVDASDGPDATPDHGYEITFRVKELKRYRAGVTTTVGNNEGSLVVWGKLPNLYGRGEMAELSYVYGTKSLLYNLTLRKPFFGPIDSILSGTLLRQTNEMPASSAKLSEQGLVLDYSILFQKVKNSIEWNGLIREILPASRDTPFAIRESAGYTLKSSLKFTSALDQRDDKILPRQGRYCQGSVEFAGLGGDVGFQKYSGLYQVNYPLASFITAQASVDAGILGSFSQDKTFSLCDRFFLGGPLSLRGFSHYGIGPKSDGSSLGGTVYWQSAYHIYTPLPFTKPTKGSFSDNFRLNLFANAGCIQDINASELKDKWRRMGEQLRISYGIGLAIRFAGLARVEINYCIPYSYQRDDSVVPGMQFGFGITFI
uniref:Sorting and assembly machinery component 50 homolog n=1 Tax=Cacopsylla melanoneura TaxID=428564 RepID=A0A8D9F6C9_9HEMI